MHICAHAQLNNINAQRSSAMYVSRRDLPIRSDEGLTLETSAFEPLCGGQFTLSTQLIKPDYLVILPTDAAPQFL